LLGDCRIGPCAVAGGGIDADFTGIETLVRDQEIDPGMIEVSGDMGRQRYRLPDKVEQGGTDRQELVLTRVVRVASG
jgi:hypothetical protein